MRRAVIYSTFTVIFLLLIGCVSRTPGGTSSDDVAGRTGMGTDSVAVDARGFDPLEFESDRVIVPTTFNPKVAIQGHFEPKEGSSAPSDNDSIVDNIAGEQIDTANSQAYRIQIYTSKVYGEARQALRVAEEIFDRPVFIDYEVPNFKVRVGNFAQRAEAEEYQQRVKSAGYTTAWVVMVTIQAEKSSPLYDKYLLEQMGIKADSLGVVDSMEGAAGEQEGDE